MMTPGQEDALYDFLENVTEPFTLDDVIAFVYMLEPKRNNRLSMEIAARYDEPLPLVAERAAAYEMKNPAAEPRCIFVG
jgi:hypothetical protein